MTTILNLFISCIHPISLSKAGYNLISLKLLAQPKIKILVFPSWKEDIWNYAFPNKLAGSKTQTALPKIWTRVIDSISSDDKCAFSILYIILWYIIFILIKFPYQSNSPVGWDCRIHRLHLRRGIRPSLNECPRYDSKQSSMIRELWECGVHSNRSQVHSSPEWLLLRGSYLSRTVWYLNCILMLNWILWNRTVFIFNCMYTNKLYLIELFVIHSNTWKH